MRHFVTSISALFVVAAAPAAGQSVAGNWNAAMHTPGGVIPFSLTFAQHGDTLSGTVHREGGDVPLSGVVMRDTVSFAYTITYNDHPLTLTMTAAMVGDSLIGSVDFAGQGSDEFWAARVRTPTAPPADPMLVYLNDLSPSRELPWSTSR